MKVNKGLSGLAFVAALAVPHVALAQAAAETQDDQGISDIVVTATKMGETSLQSTPIAVSAVSGEELAARGIRDVQDLKAYVPSLQVSDLSGYTQLYVRGIGSNSVFIGSDPSTTMHLDGVYLARPLAYLNDFLDVERIEVLRGPQGTLYGRNSVGGTINIVSRRPSDEFTAEVRGEYGNYDRYALKAYVSGPLGGGGVAASLAADLSGHDAFRENVSTGNDMENLKSRGVRGQLLVPLGEGARVTLRADYSRQSGAFGGNPKLIGPVGVPLDDSILDDPDKVSLDGVSQTVLKNHGVSADVEIEIADGIDLRSLSAYRGFRGSIDADADSSSIPLFRNLVAPIRQSQFSQEFNLVGKGDSFDWVLGAYYFQERNREPLTLTLYPFGASHVQRPLLRADSLAFFGQGEFHISGQLSVVVGLRYTTERKRYELEDRFTASTDPDPDAVEAAFPISGVPGIPDPFVVNTRRRDHALTPKFGINFKPSDNVLIYVSATRGFKSGGYDYGANNAADASAGYGPEKLWSYEAGLKSDWLDRRLRANLTAFYYDYTDLQVQSFVQNGASFGARTQNAATARVKGIEAEFVARPAGGLTLHANLAYLDARYREYLNAFVPTFGSFDASGMRLNNAPKWSATLGGSYEFDLGGSGRINAGADLHLQSRVFFTAANDGVNGVSGYPEQQDGYSLLNARIGWTSADDRWGVSLIGSNLADKNYYVGTANYTPAISARQGRPREIVGQVSLKF
jgi:iron complex outermembrane receptor protein